MRTRPRSLALYVFVLLAAVLDGTVAYAVEPASAAIVPHESHGGIDPLFDDPEEEIEGFGNFPDPLEQMNRHTLRFNGVVDRWLLDPITSTYGFIFPNPVKRSIRRFLDNVNSPAVMVNDMLQREWADAGTTASRLVINTTVGIGGLFDPAEQFGMPRHQSDFGQTLALAGVGSGPYLMLPVFGPTTTRDGLGGIVDMFLRPTTLLLAPGTQILFNTIEAGSSGIVTREANIQAIRALQNSSVDYYAALKNAYYQDRVAQIWTGREHHRASPEPTVVVEEPDDTPSHHRGEHRVIIARRFLPPGRQSSGSR